MEASDPSRIGSDQVRGVRFEGERMILIPPPRRTGDSVEHRDHVGADCRGIELATSMASAWLRHVTADAFDSALFAAAQLNHVAIGVAEKH